ncbi:MAG: hypothetical protein OXU61_01315 [Gammaproteobacteria bacterium]|nr:hypothetical protein [Gammaproteobacteria bacterium]
MSGARGQAAGPHGRGEPLPPAARLSGSLARALQGRRGAHQDAALPLAPIALSSSLTVSCPVWHQSPSF